jgi:CBS domain-containing protein
VFRYTGGEGEWLAGGRPAEGTRASLPTVAGAARRDVPTCRLGDSVATVRNRLAETGWKMCVVVNDQGVVLGLVRGAALRADGAETAGTVMESGPSTVRPNTPLHEFIEYMRRHHLASRLVTTSDGRLVGVLLANKGGRT